MFKESKEQKRYLPLILIIYILLIIGCAIKPYEIEYHINAGNDTGEIKVYNIYIDGSFSSIDKEAINDAIGDWNHGMNGYVHFAVIDLDFRMEIEKIKAGMANGSWFIMKIDSTSPFKPPDNDGSILAFCNHIGGSEIYIVRDRI